MNQIKRSPPGETLIVDDAIHGALANLISTDRFRAKLGVVFRRMPSLKMETCSFTLNRLQAENYLVREWLIVTRAQKLFLRFILAEIYLVGESIAQIDLAVESKIREIEAKKLLGLLYSN